jgi:hypothetical protein
MTEPENSSIRRSKVGEQRKKPADSRYDRGTNGGQVTPYLAEGERIVGENLYARHSVAYESLP